MAKRAKAKAPTNGFDADQTEDFIGRIEELVDDINEIKASNAKRCRDKLDSIKVVYAEAKAVGFPVGELKDVVKLRKLQDRMQKIIEDKEGEQRMNLQLIIDAVGGLGDLPLGAAAIAKAQKAATTQDAAAVDELAH